MVAIEFPKFLEQAGADGFDASGGFQNFFVGQGRGADAGSQIGDTGERGDAQMPSWRAMMTSGTVLMPRRPHRAGRRRGFLRGFGSWGRSRRDRCRVAISFWSDARL